MSDWQVGDLALCVDASDMGCRAYGGAALVEGRSYRVARVAPVQLWADFNRCCGLVLDGPVNIFEPEDGAFSERRFRKIRPDEHTDCEPEFVELLKRSTAPVERERRILEALFPARDGGSANNLPPSDK